MAYYGDDGGRAEVIPELPLRICSDDNNGDYVKLRHGPENAEPATAVGEAAEVSPTGRVGSLWYWVKLLILAVCIGLLVAVFLKWVGPFFMDKEIIPILIWERTTFSVPVLTVLLFASIALFPTLFLPSTPSMWVAGMTFGYGLGFLLIISAASVGVSLPFFIGSIFHQKLQGWLERYPKKASLLRSAGEGNWLHQFRAVALIRISPFPYIIYNYCAVATNVKYGPYIMGSLVGMVPEIFVAIYTGILIMTLADASHEKHTLSAPQIIFNVMGFCFTVATTIFFTFYAKKWLKELGREDEVLLQ
ncbi:uncharacterized protein LOC114721098 isoform X1 [Neltuma alba]|uniref:uncharacterized protein LOC114721098 isoform X1 n=1 Tax=Neltuma alba TaxID=207710 RepID=UPI0010A3D6F5|nr:uncharacterized protein LOC114721098 isoform X1 [Prosopis alba]